MTAAASQGYYRGVNVHGTWGVGNGMAEIQRLVDGLKAALKARGVTYLQVAQALELSEASVKRLFSSGRFTLDRFDAACELAGTSMIELAAQARHQRPKITVLTEDQEEDLVSDVRLLLVAVLAIGGWTFKEMLTFYQLEETGLIRLLARLDRLKLIELLPGNRYRLLTSRQFSWRPDGPVERFFAREVRAPFFAAPFAKPGERLLFLNGMLSRESLARLEVLMGQLAQSFDAMNDEDRHRPLEERFGCSLALAVRPWEPPVFARLRRPGTDDRF